MSHQTATYVRPYISRWRHRLVAALYHLNNLKKTGDKSISHSTLFLFVKQVELIKRFHCTSMVIKSVLLSIPHSVLGLLFICPGCLGTNNGSARIKINSIFYIVVNQNLNIIYHQGRWMWLATNHGFIIALAHVQSFSSYSEHKSSSHSVAEEDNARSQFIIIIIKDEWWAIIISEPVLDAYREMSSGEYLLLK